MNGVLYIMAAGCEFFAPATREWRDLDHSYCPPQPLHFSFSDGIHVSTMRRLDNPVTFARTYVEDRTVAIPLGFFVRGEPYKLLGLVPLEHHFFGIDREKLEAAGRAGDPDAVFYLLGADKYGRDVLSRIIYGARISLSVGLISIAVTSLLGIAIGGVSGYIGGAWDNVIQRFIEVVNALPQLPLWLAIGAIFPAVWSPLTVYFCVTVALSLLTWTGLARVVRGKILSLREEDYAVAARLPGASHARVLFRHLVPGFASHIIVTLTLSVPGMILGETGSELSGAGPASADRELGRDAAGLSEPADGRELSLAALAGVVYRDDDPRLQFRRRRHARRRRSVLGMKYSGQVTGGRGQIARFSRT
ncbi:MAG: ABC transporter permease [Opitutaceae bacterium]